MVVKKQERKKVEEEGGRGPRIYILKGGLCTTSAMGQAQGGEADRRRQRSCEIFIDASDEVSVGSRLQP